MPDNKNTTEARQTTSDLETFGNPDVWELVCKASSKEQGWMKSTKRMRVATGYIYQVSTEFRATCSYKTKEETLVESFSVTSCSESICFVPDFSTGA